ncbi:MAG: xanthine dehydrogenase family protein molybdopterin-binding subunit, partial [Candidatus Cloacimonadota bacterium]|nr:xanthine dehydrogenase family protein molybdopterin-binding subunit [Candidatus Cloacimonadota bacterium]
MKNLKYVGKPSVRIDGKEKISGATRYTEDIEFGPDLHFAAIVESTEAHANILSIDISEAEKYPGVVGVFTGKDFPYRFGLYMKDRYIFAIDTVQYVGQQIAAVVARDVRTAQIAAKLIKVEYEVLPAIFNQLEAFQEDASVLHPDLGNYTHVPWFFPHENTNIAHWRKVRRGDIQKGFEDADYILEDTYTVPRYSHCPIEVHAAIGLCDLSGRLTIWASSQSPHTQRNLFAESLAPLGFKNKDVRVIAPPIGGGFGGKAGVSMEILAAAIATKVKGSPVKIIWSREQEFYNTSQRLGVIAKLKMGVKKDGTFTGIDHRLYWDTGASAEYGANVVNAVGLSSIGPYRFHNIFIDSVCLYTNLPPCGAYRGFGYSEFMFGLESHINRIADHLKIDPVEIRRINAIKEDDTLAYGVPMNPNGLIECIDKVAKEIEWGKQVKSADPNKKIGKGFSLIWKAPAMPPNASSAAFIKFNEDGSLNILVSGMDMGQGYLTVMAQIAAEILAVPISKIRTENPDTDRNPYEWQTVASHVTWSCGNAVRKAAIDAREKIFDVVSRTLYLPKDMLYLEDERVKCQTKPKFELLLSDFVINGIQAEDMTFKGGPILGTGIFMPEYTS